MIAQKQVIWFNGRTPKTREIRIGFEGDNMVDRLEFAIPTISAQQTAFLMKSGPEADAITMQSDGARYYVDMTAEIIGTEGERESYVMIRGAGGEEWKSAAFTLITHDVPDISEEIEQRFPTAVEQMLESIAGHNAAMDAQEERIGAAARETETQAAAAQDAAIAARIQARTAAEQADRAKAEADRAEGAFMLGTQYAGQLLYVDSEGRAAPLRIGSGLAIIGGALVLTGSAPETGEDVGFTALEDGSIMISGVEFIEQADGSVLLAGATFTEQADGSVLIG